MSKEVITANSYRLMAMAAFTVADGSFWEILKRDGVVKLNRNRNPFTRGPGEPFDPNETAIVFTYTCDREQFVSDGQYYFIRSVFAEGRPGSGDPKHLIQQSILEGKPRDYGWP